MNDPIPDAPGDAVSVALPVVPRPQKWVPWLVLTFILAGYAFAIVHLHPTNFFGLMEDDSIYFSTAREIALGHGYVMPNLPGHPPATKYPILYPWLLSWVWRLNPNFPANLSWAVSLNVFFGSVFLAAAFVFLRRLNGIGDTTALCITAFCAVHPVIWAQSSYLMADIPFAACALIALILADQNRGHVPRDSTVLWCGFLVGCSVMLRTMGLPIAAGICVSYLCRKQFRAAILMAFSAALPILILLQRAATTAQIAIPVSNTECANSWRSTWLYYTSYGDFWKRDVLANHVLWPVIQNGLWSTLTQPASYFVDPVGVKPAILAVVLLVTLAAIAVRGLVRQAQEDRWRAAHVALGLYLLPVLLWDYANPERFLIPFLPLLAAGMVFEARHLTLQVRTTLRNQRGGDAMFGAVFFFLIGFLLVAGTFLSLRKADLQLKRNSDVRAIALSERLESFEWLRTHTAPDARILAYEDASLFLYTGRQSIRPTIFSPAGYYRSEISDRENSCLLSSAEPFAADYWLVAEDDFSSEWEQAKSASQAKEKELEHSRDPVFRSSNGRFRIYALREQPGPSALAVARK